MHKYSYPIGISDAWLLNKNYKRLLAELNIVSIDKAESLLMIENQLKKDNNIADFNYLLLDFEDEENQDYSFEDHDSQNAKTKVIYCWRSTKLSVPKIAFRLNLDSNFVQKWIEEYKKAVRRQLKINKQKAALKKLTISKIKIEQIKNFWKENFGKLIRIQDVRNGVWGTNNDSRKPWNTTIALVMKKKLRMSYRVLSTQHPKVASDEHKNLYWESVLIQMLLIDDAYELIYVDEFNISGRN